MTVLRALAYVLAFLLAASVAAVYAYVVLGVLLRLGILHPSIAAGLAPALAG